MGIRARDWSADTIDIQVLKQCSEAARPKHDDYRFHFSANAVYQPSASAEIGHTLRTEG
jgi:hypothetical protein